MEQLNAHANQNITIVECCTQKEPSELHIRQYMRMGKLEAGEGTQN